MYFKFSSQTAMAQFRIHLPSFLWALYSTLKDTIFGPHCYFSITAFRTSFLVSYSCLHALQMDNQPHRAPGASHPSTSDQRDDGDRNQLGASSSKPKLSSKISIRDLVNSPPPPAPAVPEAPRRLLPPAPRQQQSPQEPDEPQESQASTQQESPQEFDEAQESQASTQQQSSQESDEPQESQAFKQLESPSHPDEPQESQESQAPQQQDDGAVVLIMPINCDLCRTSTGYLCNRQSPTCYRCILKGKGMRVPLPFTDLAIGLYSSTLADTLDRMHLLSKTREGVRRV
ncbi:hypothetical protein B0T20DRAFT_75729 [Sordaria brevicollis]|uniref:Uncharacterized protein n=1 Tax=Sordaria brevicollis TaxID=83679 RepID=A0AAE0U5Y9_SORBR|nr:hypothetical protein B0T20DRAFT_75729 [Sordaria brevicollis]